MQASLIRITKRAILAACFLGIAGSNASASVRTSIDTFGNIPDTAAQTAVPQALQDANEILKSGMVYFDAPNGTICPGTYEELLPIVRGTTTATEMNNFDAATKLTLNRQIVSAQLTMISGACPVDGQLSGPVELLFTFSQTMGNDSQKYFYLNYLRINAVYLDGEPVGRMKIRTATKTDIFKVLSSGEMIQFKSDNADLMASLNGLSFSIEYSTFDSEHNLVGPAITFGFSDYSPKTSVTVTHQLDRERKIKTDYLGSYSEGMISVMHLKSGLMHGWQETLVDGKTTLKTCYQNHEIVKAVTCPDT